MPDDTLMCPDCDSLTIETVRRTAHDVHDGRRIEFMDELSRCSSCGAEFYSFDQSLANSRAFAAAVRDALGLLSAEQIRSARLNLGMSQPEFERALGVGKKTVVRWERGTVPPSRAANGLLWFASNHPRVFLEYAAFRSAVEAKPDDSAILAEIIPVSNEAAHPAVIRRPRRKERFSVEVGADSGPTPTPSKGAFV